VDYPESFDSWVDERDVERSLVTTYHRQRTADNVDISPALDDIKDKLAGLLLETHGPRAGAEVGVPLAALPAVAERVFDFLRKPPSRFGKRPLAVVTTSSSDGTEAKTIAYEALEDVAWLCALHLSRPNHGWGALRFHSGRAHSHSMMMLAVPLTVHVMQSKPRAAWRSSTCSMWLQASTVSFNGTTGRSEVHADVAIQLEGKRLALRKYARDTLKGCAAQKQHRLVVNGWFDLPLTQDSVALPV
jgi:hypothetical protein